MRYDVLRYLSALFATIWLATAAISADYSDGVSAQEAKDLIISALGENGAALDMPVSAARVYPPCDQTPNVAPRAGSFAMVTLSCQGGAPWKRVLRTGIPDRSRRVSVGNQTTSKDLVVVLTKSLGKGAVITNQDVALQIQPQNVIALGFQDVAQVIGRKMDIHLGQGRVLQSRHLEQNWMVHSKQPVQIVYNIAGVSVLAPGISQDQGQLGDMIWVKNSASGRNVRGVIASQNKILVRAKIK